jgi:hypothetical protein
MDKLEVDPFKIIKSGEFVKVDAINGWVEVYGNRKHQI